jgi:hypothetical protein
MLTALAMWLNAKYNSEYEIMLTVLFDMFIFIMIFVKFM